MKTREEKNDPKRGKQNPDLLSHKEVVRSPYEAHRLEGKVQNLGIKNLGHQKKKSKS